MKRRVFLRLTGMVAVLGLPRFAKAYRQEFTEVTTDAFPIGADHQKPGDEANIPVIKVIGVGGAGGRIVSNIYHRLFDAERIIAIDTNEGELNQTTAYDRILLDPDGEFYNNETRGDPQVAANIAWKAREQIERDLAGSHVVFIVAGMGGGTGSGMAPVISKIAKQLLGNDSLVVGVAATPFNDTAWLNKRIAKLGMHEFRQSTDAVIEIPNGRLYDYVNDEFPGDPDIVRKFHGYSRRVFAETYAAIAGAILRPSFVGVDLEDIRTVLKSGPSASVGWGEATGELAGQKAYVKAWDHPLLGAEKLHKATALHIAIAASEGQMNMRLIKEVMREVDRGFNSNVTITLSVDTHDAPVDGVRVGVVAVGPVG